MPQAMSATLLHDGPLAVVIVKGEVDMSTAQQLDVILAAAGAQPVVVDLTECEFIDSSGMTSLLRRHRLNRGHVLVIACPDDHQPARVLHLTFGDLLPIYPDRYAAAAAISSQFGTAG